jgi:hypothetical protein
MQSRGRPMRHTSFCAGRVSARLVSAAAAVASPGVTARRTASASQISISCTSPSSGRRMATASSAAPDRSRRGHEPGADSRRSRPSADRRRIRPRRGVAAPQGCRRAAGVSPRCKCDERGCGLDPATRARRQDLAGRSHLRAVVPQPAPPAPQSRRPPARAAHRGAVVPPPAPRTPQSRRQPAWPGDRGAVVPPAAPPAPQSRRQPAQPAHRGAGVPR